MSAIVASQVVITGAGLITSLGLSAAETWAGVRAGKSAMGPMPALESRPAGGDKPGGNGGQAPDLPGDWMAGRPREVRYLRRAIDEALAQAGLGGAAWPRPERVGCVLGTTLHGMRQGGEFLRSGDFGLLCRFLAAHTLAGALEGLPVGGLTSTTCSACSSGLGAIGLGVTLLEMGELDVVIAGGYDPVSEYAYAGFDSMRLVAGGALRPFCRGREGMKLAEGYAVVVLERAGRREALARVLGIGESADGHHLTQPHPEGEGALRAIREAMGKSGLGPVDIGLISAHATATANNDASEYAAYSRAMGERLAEIPAVGFKSHVGHTLGAAGGTELILSMMAMREGVAPPTAGVRREEVEFPAMGLLEKARPVKIGATIGTSLGFGGANACVVLGAAGAADFRASNGTSQRSVTARTSVAREVFITGVGFVAPGIVGNEALAARLSGAEGPAKTGMLEEAEYAHLINARRVRRMSEYSKMTLAATAIAFRHAGIEDVAGFAETCGAILGSMHGGAIFCHDYYSQIVREGMGAANPVLFAEGVPNAASAQLSLMLGIKGSCQTIIGSRTAGLDALRLAALRIASGQWERAIVSAAEEDADVLAAAYRHAGLRSEGVGARPFEGDTGFAASCGSATVILESAESVRARGGKAQGQIGAGASLWGPGKAGHAQRIGGVLGAMGDPGHIVSSAHGTWIDRAEAEGIAEAAARRGMNMGVSSVSGHLAEMFSVGPLAAIAGIVLTGGARRRWDAAVAGLGAGDGGACTGPIGVLVSDFSGGVSGVVVSPAAGA